MGRGKVNGEEREAEEMKVEDEKERRELNFHSKLFFFRQKKNKLLWRQILHLFAVYQEALNRKKNFKLK